MNGQQMEKRSRFNRWMRWLYYWLDLNGPDGHPANTKVLSAWGFFVALTAEVWWGWDLAKPDGPGITWPFVWLVIMTLSVAMGKDVFKAALKMRINGKGGTGYASPTDTTSSNRTLPSGAEVSGPAGNTW
jgi:hypothetical protein